MKFLKESLICFLGSIPFMPFALGQTRLELETDPFYLLFKGYSTNVALRTENIRVQILYFKLGNIPELMQKKEGFQLGLEGFSFDLDFFPWGWNGSQLFLGPVFSFGRAKTKERSTNETKLSDFYMAGARFGYQWNLFKDSGFYVAPYVAPVYQNIEKVRYTSGKVYERSDFSFMGSIHIGVSF
jgi:hypothetical protein